MDKQGYDPRVIANFVLDARDFIGLKTTQIDLQKLTFFAYESFLIRKRVRLMAGYFEAWRYGPVHPDIYSAFKDYGSGHITGRARARDVFSGKTRELPVLTDAEARRSINETVSKFSALSTRELVDLSHTPGGPWHHVVEKANRTVALGLRITDDVVVTHRPHRMLMREGQQTSARGGLPLVETPLAKPGHS